MTPGQKKIFEQAPEDWQPLPASISRTILRSLREHDLIELQHLPLRWRKKSRPEPKEHHTPGFLAFMQAVRNARKRAAKKGRECQLTLDVARELWARCKGHCELTGIRFHVRREAGTQYRAFSPSIDRRDSAAGYTLNNVRVVCTAVNVAMNQWGEDVLRRIAKGMLRGDLAHEWPQQDDKAK